MALPTLQPFYQTSKMPGDAGRLGVLVNRRARDADVKQMWTEHQTYLRSSDLRSSKQEAWTSSRSLRNSMDAYSGKSKTEEKRLLLHERREKLRQLLKREKASLESELVEMSKDSLSVMCSRTEELKSERESREKTVAREKLHDHWQTNCPALRQLKSKHMQLAAQDQWEKQILLKQQERDAIKRNEESYDLAMEEERLAALRVKEDELLKQHTNAKEYAHTLQEQMDAIKAKEREAELLEHKQHRLCLEQLEVDRAERQRKELEDKQLKLELGHALSRQHKAQLRQKSRQAQEALELDMKILEKLLKKGEEEQVFTTSRRNRAHEDVEWMKKTLAHQLDLEKQREAELDLLYQEEAARMWHKREAEWKREKVARERLMQEVLEERRQQVVQRLSEVNEMQAVSIQQREDLIKQLELNRQLSARDLRYKEQRRSKRADELHAQISARKEREKLAHVQDEEAGIKQRSLEMEYEDLVKLEEEEIAATGFQSKNHARRKMAWW